LAKLQMRIIRLACEGLRHPDCADLRRSCHAIITCSTTCHMRIRPRRFPRSRARS